jgi:hypothetical protein
MEEERKIKQDLARGLSDQKTIQQLSSSGDAARAKRAQNKREKKAREKAERKKAEREKAKQDQK